MYSLESGKLERLTNSGGPPAWLGDNRRLLYARGSKLYLVDTESRKDHEVLSVAPNALDPPTLSRDDRLMYFSVVMKEGDIWLATLD